MSKAQGKIGFSDHDPFNIAFIYLFIHLTSNLFQLTLNVFILIYLTSNLFQLTYICLFLIYLTFYLFQLTLHLFICPCNLCNLAYRIFSFI